ncbi:acylneuraminate cytidylyltransferase family protein [Litorivicinus sp.]|nr:acylneuraminate cytidylyltransferase family protein [Litorivicinus sp.]
MSVIAIIPARGGSKGIPRKNLLPMGSSSLLGHAIECAVESKVFDEIIVTTEDQEIAEEAAKFDVGVSHRPLEHAGDSAEVDPLLLWTLTNHHFKSGTPDSCALLYATAPLRRSNHVKEAYEEFVSGGFDSLLSLVADNSYLWERKLGGKTVQATNYEPARRAARQDENWNQFYENKAIYFFNVKGFLDTKCRLFGEIGFYEMSKASSIDIDSKEDYELAKLLRLHGLS